MTVDKKTLKVTETVIKAWGWEGEAAATQPECLAGAVVPLTSHRCILNKLSFLVSKSSRFQLSFVRNEA